MPRSSKLKRPVISGSVLHWICPWTQDHLGKVCVCAAVCLCLSVPQWCSQGNRCYYVKVINLVIFWSAYMSLPHILRDLFWITAFRQETWSFLVCRGEMSQGRGSFSQSCCPLECEGFIIELVRALWPDFGGRLNSNATLLLHSFLDRQFYIQVLWQDSYGILFVFFSFRFWLCGFLKIFNNKKIKALNKHLEVVWLPSTQRPYVGGASQILKTNLDQIHTRFSYSLVGENLFSSEVWFCQFFSWVRLCVW